MNKIKFLFLVLLSISILSSCKSKSEKELDALQTHISDNGITAEPTSSGLYYIETKAGTGDLPTLGDMVEVHYEGTFLNGEVFDSSIARGETFSFQLGIGQVIPGWDEGIALMKTGGKAQLILPSPLGYGSSNHGSIPAYSTLIFNVELIGIQ